MFNHTYTICLQIIDSSREMARYYSFRISGLQKLDSEWDANNLQQGCFMGIRKQALCYNATIQNRVREYISVFLRLSPPVKTPPAMLRLLSRLSDSPPDDCHVIKHRCKLFTLLSFRPRLHQAHDPESSA